MDRANKKILIVTYVFPPFAAVGVYRILKFCKYLGRFGITPLILTPENPRTLARDESLLKQVHEGIIICRTQLNDIFHRKQIKRNRVVVATPSSASSNASPKAPPFSLLSSLRRKIGLFFSIPDRGYFWIRSGLKPGIELVRKEDIDLILSSSPPQSVHILASRIAARTARPHIVDFRDLWTQNTSYDERNLPLCMRRRDRRMEKTVLRRAAGITVNTATFKKQLLEKNRFLSDDRIEVVTNGVDPDDFKDLIEWRKGNNKFTMLYTGSLYGRHRNPGFFLAAIRKWIDEKKNVASRIRIMFVGNWTAEYSGLIDEYQLNDIVEKKEWLRQRDVLIETLSADLLLLFQGFDPALKAAVPRKLYEYMITGLPILAFAPPGEIPDLINRHQCGLSLPDRSPEPIVQFLDNTYNDWNRSISEKKPAPTLRSMPELETAAQVEKLAGLCHRVG
jgi:glycosyltransferase involved in cell wall biosynthesis